MNSSRFPFLRYPLQPFHTILSKLPKGVPTKLTAILQKAKFPVRLLRYWWAGQALREESKRLGRPLVVVDIGCERGWLKHFTPEGVVSRWIGMDWVVQKEVSSIAQYDEVHQASFDERLPLEDCIADAVVSLHVFEHLPRPGSTIAEVSRLLKPGGIFLGGAPTMPHWTAGWREKYFRNLLAKGKLAIGGHITVLSPQRWKTLAEDVGLNVEFATGSHLIRRTGSFLENHRWWVRLNQLWGALFPSLGSECYLQARRIPAWQGSTDRLAPEDPHWRGLWLSLAAVAVVGLGVLGVWGADYFENRNERQVAQWLDAHQEGNDHFVLYNKELDDLCAERKDTQCVDSVDQLLKVADTKPGAHFLVALPDANRLLQASNKGNWRVDSRLDRNGESDYLLLKMGTTGTSLQDYLEGSTTF